jgi:3-dehydroquinate synthase
MKVLKVALGRNSYGIRIGAEIMERTGLWLKEEGLSGKAAVITDSNVGPLYAARLEQSLKTAGFTVTILEIAAGEAQKTLETAAGLYDKLAAAYLERNSPVIALGGGVVGDLAGFIAATYLRGVPFVQVPTSLLAMVDSSVGGKTGVDHGQLKNIVGAFYQPRMVIADTSVLKTLPREELSNGMGEVIKYAALNKYFFKYLEQNIEKAMVLDEPVMEQIVLLNAGFKAKIVGEDERESGRRAILNYGHTIGHGVEAVTGFKVKHGQAVAIGMIEENKIALRLGMFSRPEAEKIEEMVYHAGLPARLPELSHEDKLKLIEAVKHDKKVVNGKIRFTLLQSIGRAVVTDKVTPGLIGEELFGWSSS